MSKDKGGSGRIPALGSATVSGVSWTGDHTVIVSSSARNVMRNLFGDSVEDTDIADLVGAPDGARVTVTANPRSSDQLMIEAEHELYQSESSKQVRFVGRDKDGIYITNSYFGVDRRGMGLGANVFAREVVKARQMGVTEIRTDAARGPLMNGYYTWARLGFDASLQSAYDYPLGNNSGNGRGRDPGRMTMGLKSLPHGVSIAKSSLQSLMRTKAGRAWWKEHGEWSEMKFNVGHNSRSSGVLRAYMRAKGYNVPGL